MIPHTVQQTNLTRDDRAGHDVDLFVIHETAGQFPGDLNWLTMSGRVSVQWYIRRDGRLYCLDPALRACAHAGVAAWQGKGPNDGVSGWSWANLCSEGVELEGPNDGTPITPAQLATLAALVPWRCMEHQIRPDRVVRHVDISGPLVRPKDAKSDPRGLDWFHFLETLYPHHLTIRAAPRCTLDQFLAVLGRYNSPAAAEGAAIYARLAELYGIDPAVALAFFIHESSAGTAGRAVKTLNWGNVRRGAGRQLGERDGFAYYDSWLASALDWGQILIERYMGRWGLHTVERIIPTYAPSSDNNKPDRYIDAVRMTVASLAAVNKPPMTARASIGGPDGASYVCSPDVRSFYDRHGGILTFGLALADEASFQDAHGETCRALRCENAVIKAKPSMPEGWRIRPMALEEAMGFLGKA